MKISACCIIKNEEKNLPAYINCVKNIADEIIIADTGSTDNSLKLLENLKEKHNLNLQIYNFKWINDFAAAKNFALSKAVGDWIIFLDADEYFDENHGKKIRPFLEEINDNKNILTFETPRLNFDADHDNAPLSKDMQIRIFRNIEGLNYKGKIHEALYYNDKNLTTIETDFLILHNGYSEKILKEKDKRNSDMILKIKNFANDNNPITYYYLAESLLEIKDYKKSEKNIKKAIEFFKKTEHKFLIKAYIFYIQLLWETNAPRTKISSVIEKGLKTTNNHPDLLTEKLIYILNGDEYNLAEIETLTSEIFTRVKDEEMLKKYDNTIEARLPLVHNVLGVIYKSFGEIKKAEQEFLSALKLHKYNKEILQNLLSLYENDNEKIREIISEIYDENNDTDKKFIAAI